MRTRLLTSESVSEGHPDKVCDRVSDAILDAALRKNPRARVAAECLVTTDRCVVAGEIGGVGFLDYDRVVRDAIRAVGYEGGLDGFDADTVQVEVLLHRQSEEIAAAVGPDEGAEPGAGDQGIMFGYACRDTAELMPAPLHLAHRIVERLAAVRKGGENRLGPDGKSQVTIRYVDGVPVDAHTVVVSHQHAPGFERELPDLVRAVVADVLPEGWLTPSTRLLVNPSGSFVHGGPAMDTGLTGRKIVVDGYGGAAPVGGGAFSGKDPTKVDRSAAYAARWVAKNVVAAGIADRCQVELAYAIGQAEPVAVQVDTFDSGLEDGTTVARAIQRTVSLTPGAIRERLGLGRPVYVPTASYGHFGRRGTVDDGCFRWERLDLVETLLRNLG